MLGMEVQPAVPGLQPAKGFGRQQCLLCCAENPSFVSIGRCKHADICWVCSIRLRSFTRDWRCPVCKEDLKEVLLTDDVEVVPDDWRTLHLDATLGVRFCNDVVRTEAARLFEYRCRLGDCARGAGKSFYTLKELGNHLWYDHWRQFCYTCLHGRSSFLCEQHVYNRQDLHRHQREGDAAQLGGDRPVVPIPAHPQCEFCRERFYNADELLRHMYKRHHLCQLCKRQGRHNEFFSNYRCLGMHYQDQHWVCAHTKCQRNGIRLIAFTSEEELHVHYLAEHPDVPYRASNVTKDGKVKVQVGPRSFAEEARGGSSSGAGGSKGRGRGADDRATADQADAPVRFAWPSGATAADAVPDGARSRGADDEWHMAGSESEDDYERYPYREPVRGNRRSTARKQEGEDTVSGGDQKDDEGAEPAPEEEDAACPEAGAPAPVAEILLDEQLEALTLERTVATAGPRSGSRSCLSALSAVLEAVLSKAERQVPQGPAPEDSWPGSLQVAVGRLSASETEGLERMRAHLEQASGGGHGGSGLASNGASTCDWEPLERVLGLRPLFFLLLVPQSAPLTSDASSGGARGRDRAAIGPRQAGGEPASQEGTPAEATNWRRWKRAAQEAILALEPEARKRLSHYVTLSVRRREQLPKIAGAGDGDEGEDAAAAFPSLGPSLPRERAGSDDAAGVEEGPKWSQLHQKRLQAEYPTLGGGEGASGSGGDAPATWGRPGRPDAPPPFLARSQPAAAKMDPESFPSLGAGAASAPAAAAELPKWAAAAKKAVSAAAREAAAPAPAPAQAKAPAAPSKFEGVSEASFPDLPPGNGPAAPVAPKAKAKTASAAKVGARGKAAMKVAARPAPNQGSAAAAWAEHRSKDAKAVAAPAPKAMPEPAPPPPKPTLSEMVAASSTHFPGLPGAGPALAAPAGAAAEVPPAPAAAAAAAAAEGGAAQAGKKKGRGKKVLLAIG